MTCRVSGTCRDSLPFLCSLEFASDPPEVRSDRSHPRAASFVHAQVWHALPCSISPLDLGNFCPRPSPLPEASLCCSRTVQPQSSSSGIVSGSLTAHKIHIPPLNNFRNSQCFPFPRSVPQPVHCSGPERAKAGRSRQDPNMRTQRQPPRTSILYRKDRDRSALVGLSLLQAVSQLLQLCFQALKTSTVKFRLSTCYMCR